MAFIKYSVKTFKVWFSLLMWEIRGIFPDKHFVFYEKCIFYISCILWKTLCLYAKTFKRLTWRSVSMSLCSAVRVGFFSVLYSVLTLLLFLTRWYHVAIAYNRCLYWYEDSLYLLLLILLSPSTYCNYYYYDHHHHHHLSIISYLYI